MRDVLVVGDETRSRPPPGRRRGNTIRVVHSCACKLCPHPPLHASRSCRRFVSVCSDYHTRHRLWAEKFSNRAPRFEESFQSLRWAWAEAHRYRTRRRHLTRRCMPWRSPCVVRWGLYWPRPARGRCHALRCPAHPRNRTESCESGSIPLSSWWRTLPAAKSVRVAPHVCAF